MRDEGFERRPRERKAAIPCEAPSGKINFSRSSRLVRPRAVLRQRDKKRQKNPTSVNKFESNMAIK